MSIILLLNSIYLIFWFVLLSVCFCLTLFFKNAKCLLIHSCLSVSGSLHEKMFSYGMFCPLWACLVYYSLCKLTNNYRRAGSSALYQLHVTVHNSVHENERGSILCILYVLPPHVSPCHVEVLMKCSLLLLSLQLQYSSSHSLMILAYLSCDILS